MNDALIVAKQNDYDVFNALDVMQNESFLKELKFGPGDGKLHYYLYNYRVLLMSQGKNGYEFMLTNFCSGLDYEKYLMLDFIWSMASDMS
ncbi:Glycylpeptide N-tetradecanoyltransferase 1 [Camellia lanceoleosa]|uniref:Glycylpeptide N-tetradecanoyltransferase 1 n=1 Tax=Camellia lanceoleosa TaxID=1840588 RepID=A0ACC0F8J8_9ERIC|nr:Glycylpeptide N-tetradecanoyltransferase 1 [Camellia lanceoleosa]